MGFVRLELPERIAHGFLEVGGLQGLGLGKVLCYQSAEFHTGLTLLSPDEETIVFVQMYGLPDGEEMLEKDLAFQTRGGKAWGKGPKGDFLRLGIFPGEWVHTAYSVSPKRMVHLYRGERRAVFIRYIGKSLKDPLCGRVNDHLKYLPEDWHLELVNRELAAPVKPYVEATGTLEAVDLRVEAEAVRGMIVEGVKRFAGEQRMAGGDVEGLAVTAMLVFFDVENGYVSLGFDVRSPWVPDGAYSHADYAVLQRENWWEFMERFCQGGGVTLTGMDGKATKVVGGSEFDFDAAFGEMVAEVMKGLQKEKGFGGLLVGAGAEIFVEAHDATFVWPTKGGRERGENRV
jgi:hypothetical protein